MTVSIVIPVGNEAEWKVCEASLKGSIAAYGGAVKAEIVASDDLAHEGAFVARNRGLERASGEWIAWVDCDDVVEPEWFGEIARAIEAHPDADIIQFEATEVKNGSERLLPYRYKGAVAGEDFARELLRNDGMPAWLWTRVFRREILAEVRFEGRVKQDYGMFLQVLPRIGSVWSIGRPLYRYIRHGHGLSNYTQRMDYAAAGRMLQSLIVTFPKRWWWDARVGFALTMTDVAVHSGVENGSRAWTRRYGMLVLLDLKVPVRLKIKCLLAMIGVTL